MNSVHEKIQKWIPCKLVKIDVKNISLKIYTFLLGIDFSSTVNGFHNRIDDIKYNFVNGATESGALCFYGSIIMSLLQLGYINNIESLFTFSSCYILIDHYLDDNTITMIEKTKTILQINEFINNINSNNNINNNFDNPILQAIADKYIEMVTPNTEIHLKNLFHSEVKTMYLQTQDNLDRDTYLNISEWKGGLSCNAIQSLLELEITDAEYTLGACIQLTDDILDVEDDMRLGINTIATHDYRTYGNLDKIILYTINRIDNMSQKYNFFKPILFLELIFAIHTNRDKVSPEMINIIEPFIYFNPSTTKEELVKWINSKL